MKQHFHTTMPTAWNWNPIPRLLTLLIGVLVPSLNSSPSLLSLVADKELKPVQQLLQALIQGN